MALKAGAVLDDDERRHPRNLFLLDNRAVNGLDVELDGGIQVV
jgi:hypothetical protein